MPVKQMVVPNEMARQLGVTGLQLRNWLRAKKAAGHPLLQGHQYLQRWEFSPRQADRLMDEFRAERGAASGHESPSPRATPRPARTGRAATSRPGPARFERSSDPGHRVSEEWMGEKVETLADLLRSALRAVVVGINPAPKSVAAGHYYQGASGQRFFSRLACVGLLPAGEDFEDDRAFAAGIGFTDIVKRPTPRANDLRPGELTHGRELLEAKLVALDVPLIIFTFKGAATPLLGRFDGHGLLEERRLAGAKIFVMPGPMERRDRVEAALVQLRTLTR